MADAVEVTRKKKKDTWSMKGSKSVPRRVKKDPLDSPEVQARKDQVLEWRRQARLVQAENRFEMAKDEDYYDGLQWSDEDKAIVEGRGQTASVFNLVAVTIRWITGTEKRTRVDFRVLPRKAEGRKVAENKTSLMKYVSDVNKSAFERSKAFADCVKVGLGWLESGIRADEDEEPLYSGSESWRNVWYDSLSIKPDMSDARYLFREKWVDLDVAISMFPHKKAELEIASSNIISLSQTNKETGNPYLYDDPASLGMVSGSPADLMGIGSRKRVLLCEAWYRVPEESKVIRQEGATYNGAVFNPSDPVHAWALENELATTVGAHKMVMRLMMLCITGQGATVLQDGLSPYWHNKFPLTPIWAYRRGRDNAPYGVIRGIRDPQDDLNKRRSKALYILNSKQVVAEKGAVDDVDYAMEEVARPDGYIEVNPGKEFEIREQANLAQGHVDLMNEDGRFIQESGGVTDENLGRQTNAISGKAIESRQNQGYTTTSDVFDNYRLAFQLQGEKELSLIEQFYDQPKVLRLTGERKTDMQFIDLNTADGMNPITSEQSDFIVDQQDFRGTQRQAMFDTMLEMTAKLPPEVGLKLLAITFEASDLPMKDEFVKVLRDITGMVDPNEEETPEQQAEKAAKTAQQQQAAEEQRRKALAEIQLIEGKAREAVAKGSKEELNAILTKLTALKDALEIAGTASANPHVTGAADQILNEVSGVPTVDPRTVPVVNNVAGPLPAGVQ